MAYPKNRYTEKFKKQKKQRNWSYHVAHPQNPEKNELERLREAQNIHFFFSLVILCSSAVAGHAALLRFG